MAQISFSPNTQIKSSDVNTNFQNLANGTDISTNAIAGKHLATSAIFLGYAQITSVFSTSSTTAVQVTGLTVTVTIPAGGRSVKITAFAGKVNATAVTSRILSIWDGVVGSGTQLSEGYGAERTSGDNDAIITMAVVTPAAGSKTYNVGLASDAGTATTINASSIGPAFILVELI